MTDRMDRLTPSWPLNQHAGTISGWARIMTGTESDALTKPPSGHGERLSPADPSPNTDTGNDHVRNDLSAASQPGWNEAAAAIAEMLDTGREWVSLDAAALAGDCLAAAYPIIAAAVTADCDQALHRLQDALRGIGTIHNRAVRVDGDRELAVCGWCGVTYPCEPLRILEAVHAALADSERATP